MHLDEARGEAAMNGLSSDGCVSSVGFRVLGWVVDAGGSEALRSDIGVDAPETC
jgi:hypothetical protein